MKETAANLKSIIEKFKVDYLNLNDLLADIKISEDKWTLKEIIGHLIDSASNNHQRFIRLKLSYEIEFPDYNNEEWLQAQSHNEMKFSELVYLFYYFNKLIVNIIENIDSKSLNNRWKVDWDKNTSFITLENLAKHYVEHMEKHIIHFRERLAEVEKYKQEAF